MTGYTVVTNVPGDLDGAVWVVPPDGEIPTVTQSSDGALNFSAPSIAPSGLGTEQTSPAESLAAAITTTEEDPPADPVDPPVDPPADVDEDASEDTGDPSPIANDPSGCPPGRQCSPSSGHSAPRKSVVWQTPNCYARYSTGLAWLDRCSVWGSVKNDGDPQRSHWLYKQYATCKSIPHAVLRECRLASVRQANSPALTWEDWGPRADKTTTSCSSVDMSITAYGVSVGGSFPSCEKIDITKGESPADFKVAWNYGGRSVIDSEREVRYQISFGAANTAIPKLVASWGLSAYVVPGG